MAYVLYVLAIASVVVCVNFGLGRWRGGMDGMRNAGFPPVSPDAPPADTGATGLIAPSADVND